VLVAEDHAPLRRGLVSALRRAGFLVEGAETADEAVSLLGSKPFDVLLADINMPGNARLELLTKVQTLDLAVVLMTGQPSVDTAIGALQLGVVDYLTKPISPEAVIARLDGVMLKRRELKVKSSPLAALGAEDLARLSQRERQVAELLAGGKTAKDVAAALGLSANTVRNHVKSIFAKLRVHSQVELLIKLRRPER
jgi:DNA-binding NarL/FixJ family response regulator